MTTTGIKGYGLSLSYGRQGGGSYPTSFGYVRDVDGPAIEYDDIDVTTNSSTNAAREYIAGLYDGGEVGFDCIHDAASTATNVGLAGTTYSWNLTLSDNSYWTFDGYVKSVGNSSPMGDAVTTPISIKVTGEVEFTSGVGS